MTINERIAGELCSLAETEYGDFQARLTPDHDRDYFIGVRTPMLRKMAREYAKDNEVELFLRDLPHAYFEENQLHAFIISQEKDMERCIEQVNAFLHYVDNWATCDQLSPKVFAKNKDRLLEKIYEWIDSEHTYTVRFGIEMLMRHFLDEDFDVKYANLVADLRSGDYYINMMIAWYFATGLAKQYDAILPFFDEQRLDDWTHNKAIQKARESFRVTKEQKEYLNSLKVNTKERAKGGSK